MNPGTKTIAITFFLLLMLAVAVGTERLLRAHPLATGIGMVAAVFVAMVLLLYFHIKVEDTGNKNKQNQFIGLDSNASVSKLDPSIDRTKILKG